MSGKPLPVTDEFIIQLLELHEEGLSNRQLAARLGCTRERVAYWLGKNERKSNRLGRQAVAWVNADIIKCYTCEQHKSASLFETGPRTSRYHLSSCVSCHKMRAAVRLNSDPQRLLAGRQTSLKNRCVAKNIVYTLPAGYLYALWSEQGGRCFYTDVPMEIKFGQGLQEASVSVDQVVYTGGYTPDNIVLCAHRANSIKSNMTLDSLKLYLPTWWDRAQAFLDRKR